MLLQLDKSIQVQHLSEAIEALVQHHDALRFKYSREKDSWKQYYGAQAGKLVIEDLRSSDADQYAVEVRQICQKSQQQLNGCNIPQIHP